MAWVRRICVMAVCLLTFSWLSLLLYSFLHGTPRGSEPLVAQMVRRGPVAMEASVPTATGQLEMMEQPGGRTTKLSQQLLPEWVQANSEALSNLHGQPCKNLQLRWVTTGKVLWLGHVEGRTSVQCIMKSFWLINNETCNYLSTRRASCTELLPATAGASTIVANLCDQANAVHEKVAVVIGDSSIRSQRAAPRCLASSKGSPTSISAHVVFEFYTEGNLQEYLNKFLAGTLSHTISGTSLSLQVRVVVFHAFLLQELLARPSFDQLSQSTRRMQSRRCCLL